MWWKGEKGKRHKVCKDLPICRWAPHSLYCEPMRPLAQKKNITNHFFPAPTHDKQNHFTQTQTRNKTKTKAMRFVVRERQKRERRQASDACLSRPLCVLCVPICFRLNLFFLEGLEDSFMVLPCWLQQHSNSNQNNHNKQTNKKKQTTTAHSLVFQE